MNDKIKNLTPWVEKLLQKANSLKIISYKQNNKISVNKSSCSFLPVMDHPSISNLITPSKSIKENTKSFNRSSISKNEIWNISII